MAQRDKSAVSVASSSSASLPSSAPPAPPSGERWGSAIGNLGELGANVESLQKLLARRPSSSTTTFSPRPPSPPTRPAPSSCSSPYRERQAEATQRAAEQRAQDVTKELENTSRVFQLHMEELRTKQQEIAKRDSDIKVLEAIIQTLSSKDDGGSSE
ncbi:hypothetical protein ACQ4PT_069508 [Festuca glaucescens]